MIDGQPVVLDVCCGEGGASRGYADAGMLPVGVDLARRPNGNVNRSILARYPYRLVVTDALDFLRWADLTVVDLIHASFPCQRFSKGTPAGLRESYPDLISPGRALLNLTGKPWVIENVPGAPIRADLKLCGCMFGLAPLRRERWFETSWHAYDLRPPCLHLEPSVAVLTGGARRDLPRRRPAPGAPRPPHQTKHLSAPEAARMMGIDWMTTYGRGEAIPPAYTEYIGRLWLADHLPGEATA